MDAPEYATAIEALYDGRLNYRDQDDPWSLFLDLIGWSHENFGRPQTSLDNVCRTLGYMELGQLANALDEYSERPTDCRSVIDQLVNGGDEDE